MKYIGNYKNWITKDLMTHLQTYNGDTRPVWQPERWSGHPLLEEYKEMCKEGYSNKTHDFQQFNANTEDMKDFPIILPDLPETRKYCHWWFIKLLPGQMQSMHIDPHLLDVKDPVRYTMFLEDYHPGHIFIWDDSIASNYKSGDVFEWSDPMIVHGCVNISYKTRYTLQITMHD